MTRTSGPALLATCGAYNRYLQHALTGEACLPRYEQNDNRERIVYHGEVFCRVPGCIHGRIPLANTTNLRAHLRRHGVLVARPASGRVSQGTAYAVAACTSSANPTLPGGPRHSSTLALRSLISSPSSPATELN
ncbi:unnamed protein product [Penicillium camemberti]|uniref:Str. FM013 n=1 Tax=Penicillium camemberti (strain FM 013) TaxID=1429867 RepID=A0A0G4P0D7_PENC3|nr:unnamed protein product [Penicillium camemberti]